MLRKKPNPIVARKLLVAAVGVATINYVAVACGGKTDEESSSSGSSGSSGNSSSGRSPTSGNLPSPRPNTSSSSGSYTSGNLPSPVPYDAGPAVDDGGDPYDGSDRDR